MFDFQVLGGAHHAKYKEKWIAVLLISADRRILSLITDGQIYGMKSKKCLLFSRFGDGRVLRTCDEAGTADLDPQVIEQILMKADFEELLRAHMERALQISLPEEFDGTRGWSEYHDLNRRRIDRIVAAGLARYRDPGRAYFSYTPWGSFRATIIHGFKQVLSPRNHVRNWKPRPGEGILGFQTEDNHRI